MKRLFSYVFFACVLLNTNISAQVGGDLAAGIKYLQNENYTEAMKVFEGLAKDPKNAVAHYYIGQVKYALEDYKSAEAAYNKGYTISNKCNECAVGIAKMKMDAGADLEATKLVENLAKSNKKSASVLAMLGDAYLFSKKPNAKKAIEYYIKSRDIDPKVGSTWAHMGDAYNLTGDKGNAMTSYEVAVEKDKTNLEAYMSMAKIWANSRQLDLAIEKLEQAIKLVPDYAPAYKDMYELYIRARKFDKVVPLLEKYVSLSGSDIPAKVRLVKFLCFQAKDYDRAILEGEKLVAQKVDDYTINRWLAWSYGEKEKWQECFDASNKLLAEVAKDNNRKSFQSDYEYLAKAALKLNKLDEASKAYDKIIEFDPSKGEQIYGDFAKNYFDTKNYAKALEFYKKKGAVKALGSTDLYYVAMSHYNSGNMPDADAAFTKVVEATPTYVTGWVYKARIADKSDSADPATKTFVAKAAYQKVVEVASGDKEKNKRVLLESYNYLAYAASQQNDTPGAIAYFESVLALDPTNATVADNLAILKGTKK
jgi:tetratricopeptide (TPR) repeat protein